MFDNMYLNFYVLNVVVFFAITFYEAVDRNWMLDLKRLIMGFCVAVTPVVNTCAILLRCSPKFKAFLQGILKPHSKRN